MRSKWTDNHGKKQYENIGYSSNISGNICETVGFPFVVNWGTANIYLHLKQMPFKVVVIGCWIDVKLLLAYIIEWTLEGGLTIL